MRKRRPPFRIIADSRGFSMVEAVMVLVIIAILAPIVVSRTSTDTIPLLAEAEILKSNLRYAQIRAMNDTVTWGISIAGATTYTLVRTGYTAPNLSGDNSATHTLTGGVTISSGVGTVLFNEWGTPSTDTPITLSQGGQSSTVTITKNTGYIP